MVIGTHKIITENLEKVVAPVILNEVSKNDQHLDANTQGSYDTVYHSSEKYHQFINIWYQVIKKDLILWRSTLIIPQQLINNQLHIINKLLLL